MKINVNTEPLKKELEELNKEVSQPDSYADPNIGKKHRRIKEIEELLELVEKKRNLKEQIEETKKLIDQGGEIAELAEAELPELKKEFKKTKEELKTALTPKDPNDDKDIIMEIRAGTGGDEAALFAGDLYRMYLRFAEKQGWKTELVSESRSDTGGFKEVSLSISGEEVYKNLKFESGVHRVQRVPETESQGRVHTSAATVAVLPEAEEADVEIKPQDLRIDYYRASGHGGQSVNTTDSAVRITHEPTGVVATCQDEKSQSKNKAKAMKVLRARILAKKIAEEQAKLDEARKSMIGSGDRSEKIRTYNFPQDRITDHRIGYTRHSIPQFLDGDIDDVLEALQQKQLELVQDDDQKSSS